MKRTLRCLRGLIVTSLVCASTAEPCDQVVVRVTPRDALSRFEYVFAGKVVRAHSQSEWTVEPVRVWKGTWSGDRKQFRVENRQGMCGVYVGVGEYYLFYMNEEGGDIRQAGSLRQSRTRDDIGALDRARKRPPLRLPEEAIAAPESAASEADPDCLYKWRLAHDVEADLLKVESVVVGQFASTPTPGVGSDLEGDLIVSATIKGRVAASLPVHLPAHPMLAQPTVPAIWFLGSAEAGGRRPIVRTLSLENEKKVRRRHERWKKDGLVCHGS